MVNDYTAMDRIFLNLVFPFYCVCICVRTAFVAKSACFLFQILSFFQISSFPKYCISAGILKEERKYLLGLVKKIKATGAHHFEKQKTIFYSHNRFEMNSKHMNSKPYKIVPIIMNLYVLPTGCNVLLIQKSILRDAVNDVALHFLAKVGILVVRKISLYNYFAILCTKSNEIFCKMMVFIMQVRDVERDDVEWICKMTGCTPAADIETFKGECLGDADLVRLFFFKQICCTFPCKMYHE